MFEIYTSLTVLTLNRNEIGNDGAAALGECLKYNTSLTELSLYGNEIGYNGASALGKLELKRCPSLRIHLY